jgi:glycosyltransferase involved in cell wall biosynthesis
MKILQLLSDWKWTGPAEPVVSLCESLVRQGVDVTLAFRETPMDYPDRTVAKQVKDRTIPSFNGLRLNRYFSVRDWWWDLKMLRSYVLENNVDIVHTNLSHDHFTALLSLVGRKGHPLVVRTDHKRDGLEKDAFMQKAFNATDGLVTYSRRIGDGDIRRFAFPKERTCILPPGVKPFTGTIENVRPSLGLKAEDIAIGVIGRLKKDRGYDVILKAFARLKDRAPRAKLIIVGRSSQIEETIVKPLEQLGLTDHVILAGYRTGDYFSVIASFDVFVMMRAGSDGTARALREVMAMGIPAIVSDLGMLPELVEDGSSGFVVKPDETELAARMEELACDEEKRRNFGESARHRARAEWSYAAQTEKLAQFYENLLRLGRRHP